MPDYSKGKVYAIRSYQTDSVYIGSTCQSLSMRMGGHRAYYKRHQNGHFPYVSSFEIIKYDDAYIELLEECKCENKQQLEKREGELIRENDCVNKCIPRRTRAEHYQDNKETLKEKARQYREDNKEQIKEKNKQYREDNKEKIKETKKQYHQANKERIKEYNKQYHQDNKERMNEQSKKHYQANKERRNEKFNCECGGKYTRDHKAKHMLTKKHTAHMEATV
jgi:hypothetical protein